MKMNKKQLQFDGLLAVLHQNSDYITAKSLSEQLNLSEKTVYRLVKEINQNYFPDELIIKKRGRGFKLNRLKNYATLINSKQNDFTPASRQLQILERLLTISPKKLLIYDLAQEYYVSDSVIMKDKIEIQKRLNPFHLKISTRTGYIFITGSELDIRRALADLVLTFSMIDIDNLSNTTNQSHFDLELAKIILEEIDQIETVIKEICQIVDGPVSAEVTGVTAEEMIAEARDIAKWADNIVVKIPMTMEGVKTVNVLSKENIKTNVTLIFTVSQGLMAIKAGATFISPFVGRLEDIGTDAYQLISDLREIIDFYGFDTEIIAASIRNTVHVENVAKRGAHIATIPDAVFDKMTKHPVTTSGIKNFTKDWETFKNKVE